MNNKEKQEIKEKIKASMLEHLISKGYNPKEPDKELVLQEIKPMWIKLEEEGLIQEGMKYEIYHTIVYNQYIMTQLDNPFM